MHTPLPWKLDLGLGAPEIVGNSRRIARVLYDPGSEDNEVDYNARFIVRACNSHADLLEALEIVLVWLDEPSPSWPSEQDADSAYFIHGKVKQAIERAK